MDGMVSCNIVECNSKKCNIDLREKRDKFMTNRSDSNYILDIISSAMSDEKDEILIAQNILQEIFVCLLEKNQLYIKESEINPVDSSDQDKETIYRTWLQERYADAKKQLCENLHDSSSDVQKNALSVLMMFIHTESLHPQDTAPKYYFPSKFFQEIITNIISEEGEKQILIDHFLQEYLVYNDIKLYTLKAVLILLKNKKKECCTLLLDNVFLLLSKINFPAGSKRIKKIKLDKRTNFIQYSDNEDISLNYQYLRKLFTSAWTSFLTFQLSPKLHKRVLLILDRHILPHCSNPLLLTDFLTESYKIGGAVSLLALSGIYSLMQNYNLEYPDFFKKFYALFEPSVFYSKYKARFFYLADLFLSSTHIPEYMVAAFIKRLARLSLTAPVPALLVIVPFICNLLIRHQQLKSLICHSSDEEIYIDPYIMEETDPSKCRAMESSLWEIKTLQSHWNPDIAIKAKFINKSLPKMETDLSEFYELNSHELFQKECMSQYKNDVPLNFYQPTGLFERKEDIVKDMWLIE